MLKSVKKSIRDSSNLPMSELRRLTENLKQKYNLKDEELRKILESLSFQYYIEEKVKQIARTKLRKSHVHVDKLSVFRCIELGFDKRKTLKETGISQSSYYYVKKEFDALNSEERKEILAKAKQAYDDKLFNKNFWFKWDYLHEKGESQILIIQKWYDVMLMRNVKKRAILQRIRRMRDICYGVHGKHKKKIRIRPNRIPPHVFDEKDGVQWILLLKKSNLKGEYGARMTIRNFLKYARAIEPTQISGEKDGYGNMVNEYFRQPELDRIYNVLDNCARMPEFRAYAEVYGLSMVDFQSTLKTCVMFMHHSATRAKATRRVKAENFEIFEYSIPRNLKKTQPNLYEKLMLLSSNRKTIKAMQVTVFDKGKKGKEKRVKPILATLQKQLLKYGVQHRNGKLFPFNDEDLRDIMKKVYKKSGIERKIKQPLHVWRHTFAKHYHRKTNYNTTFCCTVGGWGDEKTFKDCYGKPELKDFIPLALTIN